jgi:hypothetical protein
MLVQEIGKCVVAAILEDVNVGALGACRLQPRFDCVGSAILRTE